MHGKGDSLESYREFHRETALPQMDFLLINGPLPFLEGRKWMNDEPRHEQTLAVVRWLLFDLIEELKAFGYRTENILWLGHSQGGRVASDFIMHSDDAFMGLIGVSSYVGFFDGWSEKSSASSIWKTPWLFTHGTEDEIIRLREIRNDVRELNRARVPLTYREFHKGHDFDHGLEIPYIRNWILNRLRATKTPTLPIEIGGHTELERKTSSTPESSM